LKNGKYTENIIASPLHEMQENFHLKMGLNITPTSTKFHTYFIFAQSKSLIQQVRNVIMIVLLIQCSAIITTLQASLILTLFIATLLDRQYYWYLLMIYCQQDCFFYTLCEMYTNILRNYSDLKNVSRARSCFN
jgi:hypothetical protein